MSDLISQILSIPTPFNMIVLIVFIGAGCGTVTAIASEIRKYACHRDAMAIKRELVDRGMSAEEIEQVIQA